MQFRDLILGVAVMCVWGFNFVVIKLGVDHLDPLILVALRFTLATIPVIFFVRRPDVPWHLLIAYGICFGVGVWGMVTWSIEMGISAGMAGLLLQMNVVISILLGWLVLREQLSVAKALGALLAVSGVLLSLTLEDGSVTLAGLVLVMLGAVSWSMTGLIMKAAKTDRVFAFIVWGMLFAPLPLFLVSWFTHGAESFAPLLEGLDAMAWFSILFQAYPTTLLGYWIWNRLIVKYPLSTVAPLTFLVPIFGLLGSALFLGESISSTKLIAAGLVIGGLLVGMLKLEKLPFVSARA